MIIFINGILLSSFVIFLGTFEVTSNQDVFACDHEVYCKGDILDYIQRKKVFEDGKTFVDLNLKESPATVVSAFQALLRSSSGNPSKSQLQDFTKQYFDGPGTEFEPWDPEDYTRLPSFMEKIKDPLLRDFGWNLCRTWKDLGRKIKLDVRDRPDRYSLVYLPNPFIVPGGRFRETYYWDSYWVIKGLLICEMNTTVRGMLENFSVLVNKFGFIPNGGRIYFSGRSQPPFFIPMVYEYYKATQDLEFIRNISSSMEEEYLFWKVNRTIDVMKNGDVFQMNRYSSAVNTPRPESYLEDIKTAENLTQEEKRDLFSDITSACESGWDFSSRWLSRDTKSLSLSTLTTRDIIPVDLNSLLYLNEKILSEFFHLLGNDSKSSMYLNYSHVRKEAIEAVFWNEERGIWQDYSIATNASRDYFFPSNLFPLFVDSVDDKTTKITKVLEYLDYIDIINYDGGIPTSLLASNQQWDFPNGWPPLQQTFIWALENSENAKASSIAFNVTKKWINSNWIGWNRTRNMFEKYSVVHPGSRGGGGEYGVQEILGGHGVFYGVNKGGKEEEREITLGNYGVSLLHQRDLVVNLLEGFGWTNGVILDILEKYGDRLTSPVHTPVVIVPVCISRGIKCETTSLTVLLFLIVNFYIFR